MRYTSDEIRVLINHMWDNNMSIGKNVLNDLMYQLILENKPKEAQGVTEIPSRCGSPGRGCGKYNCRNDYFRGQVVPCLLNISISNDIHGGKGAEDGFFGIRRDHCL